MSEATSPEETMLSADLGCGEDVGNFGDVIIDKDGRATLKYDHGGIPWFLTLLYLGYITFAVAYSGTYLVDLF